MSDIDPRHAVFQPQFSASARTGLSAAEAKSWSPILPRDPRLLVPVDVEALVVVPGSTEPTADIAVRLLRAPEPGGETFSDNTVRSAPPFSVITPRAPGVYLHWALPDGLTAGRTTDATVPDGQLNLRPLPNRWLVVRLDGTAPRTTTAWVVESDRGRRVRLADWAEDTGAGEGPTPDLDPATLTAVSGGDPAWAAIFDNVEDRFAMYDDLTGTTGGPLSFVVIGWYSRPDLDPIHGAGDLTSFTLRLEELHWYLDEAKLAAAFAGAQSRVDSLRVLALANPPLMSGPMMADLLVGDEVATVPNAPVPPKMVGPGGTAGVHRAPAGPRQSLFHGVVHGVRADGVGGDNRPRGEDLSIAVGGTGVEAMAAYLRARVHGDDATERLLGAFGHGMLSALSEADGVVAIEEELHHRRFFSLPGGYVEERIRMGDALAPLRGEPLPLPGSVIAGGGRAFDPEAASFEEVLVDPRIPSAVVAEHARRVQRNVSFDLFERSPAAVGALFEAVTGPARVPPVDPLRFVTVRRALPRWYVPADPLLVIGGLNRSLRHGHDGRLEPHERLDCRLSNDITTGYQGVFAGADAVAGRLEHGGVPDEADTLVREAALRDWNHLEDMARLAATDIDLPAGAVLARLEAERDLSLHSSLPGSDAALLAPASLADGGAPSPMWVTYWRQPWVPIYLEWEVELAVDDRLDRWRLGELDLEQAETAAGSSATTVAGRSLLTAGAAKALARAITDFLSDETHRDEEGTGLVTEEEADVLRALGQRARFIDTMGSALASLREHLLGYDSNAGLSGPDEDHVGPTPARDPRLVVGGSLRIKRLRVVDAFGRLLDLPETVLTSLAVSDQLSLADQAGVALQAPRVNAPSRLLLRFVAPDNDAVEALVDQEEPSRAISPVAGWLLPDHVDGALELFDAQGEPIGQLLHEDLGGGVIFEGAPGRPGPAGAAPTVGQQAGDRHTAGFIVGLVRRDVEDRQLTSELRPPESPLAALLRAIDTTLWTIDPFGLIGLEHVSILTGRPIAMVRARLELQVQSDVDGLVLDEPARQARQAAFDALTGFAFTVRLGALSRLDDGLLGYFLDDDYSLFHPVHPAVLSAALPGGPRQGFLGPHDEVAGFAQSLPGQAAPITHRYLAGAPEFTVRPGQRRRLTLLMSPGGKVHLTSGINPRKHVALARSWIDEPLTRLVPSFRLGPVLVDPATVRLPKVAALAKEQVFTRRTGPETWRDDPIVAATQQALLPDTRAMAQEGYIRVRLDEEEG